MSVKTDSTDSGTQDSPKILNILPSLLVIVFVGTISIFNSGCFSINLVIIASIPSGVNTSSGNTALVS